MSDSAPALWERLTLADIEKHGFVLTPGRYVGAEEQVDDGEPFADKYTRLRGEVEDRLAESAQLADAVRESLSLLDGTPRDPS